MIEAEIRIGKIFELEIFCGNWFSEKSCQKENKKKVNWIFGKKLDRTEKEKKLKKPKKLKNLDRTKKVGKSDLVFDTSESYSILTKVSKY